MIRPSARVRAAMPGQAFFLKKGRGGQKNLQPQAARPYLTTWGLAPIIMAERTIRNDRGYHNEKNNGTFSRADFVLIRGRPRRICRISG